MGKFLNLPKEYSADFSNPRVKPIGDVEIDWSNPLAEGLKGCFVFSHSTGAANLVDGCNPVSFVGTEPEISVKNGRLGLNCNGLGAYDYGNILNVSGPLTFVASVYDSSSLALNNGICGKLNNSHHYNLKVSNASQIIALGINEHSSATYPPTIAAGGLDFMHDKWNPIAAKWDGSNASVTTSDGSNTESRVTTLVDTNDSFMIGNQGFSSNYLTQSLEYLFIFDRCLSDSEDADIRANPYQLLKPKAQQTYFIPSAQALSTYRSYTLPKEYSPDFSNPRVKPVGDVEVDWGNSLSHGLYSYGIFGNSIIHAEDLANTDNYFTAKGALPRIKEGEPSFALNVAGGNANWVNTTKPLLPPDDDWTVVLRLYRLYETFNDEGIFAQYTSGQAGRFIIRAMGSNALTIFDGGFHTITVAQVPQDRWSFVTVWRQNGTYGAVVNGAESTVNPTSATSIYQGANTVVFGQTFSADLRGYGSLSMLYNRRLAINEIRDIESNPYQLLKPKVQPSYTVSSSAVNFNAYRQAILNAITSTGVEAHGFIEELKSVDVSAVERISPTEFKITLPAMPSFSITADETITVTIPNGVLVTSTGDIIATPTFDITDDVIAFQAFWARNANTIIG